MNREAIEKALAPGGPFHGLTQYDQFLVYELRMKPGADKMTKIPLLKGGINGNLMSAQQALASVRDWSTQGVAFVFRESDPFFLLDADSAKVDGKWSALASRLFHMLPGAGYEKSSSGTGLHLIGRSDPIEHSCRKDELGLEFYTKLRLVALTGESVRGDVNTDLTEQVKALVAEFFPPKPPRERSIEWADEACEEYGGEWSDDELIEMLLKRNPKVDFAAILSGGKSKPKASFAQLFENDIDALMECFPTSQPEKLYDYSAADLALAGIFSFWTGRNPVRIDRLMRRSALERPKWDDHATYMERTITLACETGNGVYGQPREVAVLSEEAIEGAWLPADPDYHGETDGKAIAVRMLAGDEKTGKLSKALQAGDLGYVANSALFNSGRSCDIALEVVQTLMPDVEEAAARSAVVSLRGASENFRGRVEKWDRAPSGEPVEVLPLELLRTTRAITGTNDHYRDALALAVEVFQKRLGGFEGAAYWWDGRMWTVAQESLLRRFTGEGLADGEIKVTNGRIAGTVAVLKDQLPIMGQINPPSVLVFFQNCVLNVVDGKVTAHNQAYRNGYLIGCDYDPEAACPQFEAWLHEIFESDRGRVGLLQEIFGWCLITENLNIQKAVTLVGAPRAGKGTILSLLTGLLGDAAGAFQLADLVEDKVLAGMMNRNVAIDYDAASPDRNSSRQVTGKFKAITANEPIAVRLLYTQQPFQGRLNCKLVLAANSVPTLWDDTGASPNRWVPLVFDKSYLGREDAGLAERLMGELPGIAIWALEGLARLIENRKFTLPQSSLDELAGLVDNASPYDRFLDEMCQFGPEERVTESDVWEAYTKWAIGYGMEPGKRPTVLESIKDTSRARGVRRSKSLRIGERVVRGFYGMDISGAAPPTSNVKQIRGAP